MPPTRSWLLAALMLPSAASFALNVSSASVCSKASDICSCADLAPGCGWCSSSQSCAPANQCTTTCRECPSTHKTCRSSCRRQCVDTCALMSNVCGCSELDGCGWCSHAKRCQPYPECSTTCEECDPSCANHKHCQAKCYVRFHPTRHTTPVDDSLFPLGQSDLMCASAVFLATVMASAAGIGGGAVLVPLFTLLGEFTEHEAIPLSIATVFGSSFTSLITSYLWQRHPLVPHRPLIAYDAAVILLPACLLGSTAGVFLNKLCPNWLIVVLLVALCAFSGKRTLAQAFKRREKESREQTGGAYATVATSEASADGHERIAEAADADGAEMTEIAAPTAEVASRAVGEGKGPQGGGANGGGGGGGGSSEGRRALASEVAAESSFPWSTYGVLGRTWLVVMALSLLKGGHGAPSLLGVTCGTLGYWGVVLINIPVLTGLTLLAGRALIAKHARRLSFNYVYVEGDVQWDGAKVRQYPSIVAVGAIAAGMLGVGGGMILGPIFNELEFLPQVASATSTIMVLFMSSANVGQFIVFGMLEGQYALFYGFVGVVGAIVGTKGAKVLLDRTGRASFLLFFLAAILLASGVLMASTGVPQIMRTGLTGFRPLCGRSGAASRRVD